MKPYCESRDGAAVYRTPTGMILGSLLGILANWGGLIVFVGAICPDTSSRSLRSPWAVFLRFAMALRIGPRSRVATASRTGPRSTWRPAGGSCGFRALERPPTTAPSRPPDSSLSDVSGVSALSDGSAPPASSTLS